MNLGIFLGSGNTKHKFLVKTGLINYYYYILYDNKVLELEDFKSIIILDIFYR